MVVHSKFESAFLVPVLLKIFFTSFQEPNANNLKYVSLITLTVQNSAVSLCMRYAKTRDGDIFFSSTG